MLWLCLHFPKLPLEALIPKPSFGDASLRVVIEASRVVTCDDEVEALISAISYAAQSKSKTIDLEYLRNDRYRQFANWWNELDKDHRKRTARLFNAVTQLRNRLLHGWTSKNSREKSKSLKKKKILSPKLSLI